MIMDITYGHRIHSLDDHYVRLVHDTTSETVRAGSPGSMLVDFFPIRKFPSLARRRSRKPIEGAYTHQ